VRELLIDFITSLDGDASGDRGVNLVRVRDGKIVEALGCGKRP
jgi:hypothetical protein